MEKRVVIFSGGHLGQWALNELKPTDVLVGADRGALFLVRHGYRPHVSLGDFDSVTDAEFAEICQCSAEVIRCDPVAKNSSDTEMAVDWALKQQSDELILFGALGTRFDHSLANIHLLYGLLKSGLHGKIIDAYNEIELLNSGSHRIEKGRFHNVSLLPLSPEVTGITLEGFQYPLRNATLTIGQSLGVSNVLTADVGKIDLLQGYLLVMKSSDY